MHFLFFQLPQFFVNLAGYRYLCLCIDFLKGSNWAHYMVVLIAISNGGGCAIGMVNPNAQSMFTNKI